MKQTKKKNSGLNFPLFTRKRYHRVSRADFLCT